MRTGELIRAIVIPLVSFAIMFFGQPWLYQSRLIRLSDVRRIEAWISNYYMPAAGIVFGVSLFMTFLWFILASRARVDKIDDRKKWEGFWWCFLGIACLAIVPAIYFYAGSNDANLSLIGFFALDILLIFWFTTATSTPGSLQNAPPGAFFLRRLIG